jgi:hypothetical protein
VRESEGVCVSGSGGWRGESHLEAWVVKYVCVSRNVLKTNSDFFFQKQTIFLL